jgi:hypothetical protein
MTTPTVTRTTKQLRLGPLADAIDALDAAYSAMKRTAPSRQDFALQPGNAYGKATGEHHERMDRLDDLMTEFRGLMIGITTQG